MSDYEPGRRRVPYYNPPAAPAGPSRRLGAARGSGTGYYGYRGSGAQRVCRGYPERRHGRGGRAYIPVAAIAGLVGALVTVLMLPVIFGVNPSHLFTGKLRKQATTADNTSTTDKAANVAGSSTAATDVSAIAKKVTPSIVNIDVQSHAQAFSGFRSGVRQGTGSGVIYRSDGYIITNNHVVENAESITVTLASGQKLSASLVGTDPQSDIAVVKIDKADLPALSVGDSDALDVGQVAVAVGSPYGFEQTVTSGIVSALDRDVTTQADPGRVSGLTGLIQTDAAINPGNSGGALCDSEAKLIGIATIIASSSGGSEGVGFAIPANTAVKVADAIIG